MLELFNEIKIQSSVDKVLSQLRTLIVNGELKPGDILPSERKLAEKLGVGRLTIREAIRKLEFYGMVKTHPQSGTEIKGRGILAFEGLISEILNFEEADFKSLVETRNLLEIKSAGTAALKRSDKDIIKIKEALKAFENKMQSGESTKKEDFLFHQQIAEVSGNTVLKLLMRIITPELLKNNISLIPNTEGRSEAVLQEHRDIVDLIIAQDAKGAKNAMRIHLRGTTKIEEKDVL